MQAHGLECCSLRGARCPNHMMDEETPANHPHGGSVLRIKTQTGDDPMRIHLVLNDILRISFL